MIAGRSALHGLPSLPTMLWSSCRAGRPEAVLAMPPRTQDQLHRQQPKELQRQRQQPGEPPVAPSAAAGSHLSRPGSSP
jgi:hypothetical protein